MLAGVTFTGVDDACDLDHLLVLSRTYPFLEWGVLLKPPYSREPRAGRYPSLARLQSVARLARQRSAQFALHACKDSVLEILDGQGPAAELAQSFRRVQLNDRLGQEHVAALRALLQRQPETVFITQHNTDNFNLWPHLCDLPNYAVLFDRSLGRGVVPAVWPCPLMPGPRIVCGYAGGLGASNLEEQLVKIERATRDETFWIDMESSLRGSSNTFDLLEAEKIAQLVARRYPQLAAGVAA